MLLEKRQESIAGEALTDLWAMAGLVPIEFEEGGELRLVIEDAASRLNLNAVLSFDESGAPNERTAPLLLALLQKVIEEIPLPPAEKLYEPEVLVQNLIDHVDPDEVSLRGGSENDAFERGESEVGPADRNRPLLSVDELRLVEGFDATLVEALRPYVTVYPYVNGGGVNPNTAPPHVLALIYHNDGVELRLASEDAVRSILKVRQEGGRLCDGVQSEAGCTPIGDIVENANATFPPLTWRSDVFVVTAEAQVGSVQRRIETVVDRSKSAPPLLLSWRVL
jgi:general secretion pathway protein K